MSKINLPTRGTDPAFIVVPCEVRYVSLGQFGGWCFVWLDILDQTNQRNSPKQPYGWHAKYVTPDIPLGELFTGNHFGDHINWAIVSRERNARTTELESLARKAQ